MTHLDLFSGIGGFALAADRVFGNVEHTFCEIDPFCQEVLKKHWPNSKIYGDIRTLTNTTSDRLSEAESLTKENGQQGLQQNRELARGFERPFILTGGFPCQPFSQAGRRKGTADDRHLWPEMLRVIREFAPLWVVGENVGGFVTWNDGMVLRQVFADLEGEGYEVQAFIIPAVAKNAPHRRDRIWIIAKSITNTQCERYERQEHKEGQSTRHSGRTQSPDWSANWFEVATRLCRMDDGLPRRLDRNFRLKALGNAIVPQVAEEIFKAIKNVPKKLHN